MTDSNNTPNPDFCGYDFSVWKRMTPDEQRRARAVRDAVIVKERREQVAALQAKIDEDRKARADAAVAKRDAERRARIEADVKRAFMAAGGTETEFDEVGERLTLEHLEAITRDRLARDREAMRTRLAKHF